MWIASACVVLVHVRCIGWAEAHIKIARMTLTVKLDRNWSSFQLANSAPPLSVTDSAIAPSARMHGIAWGTLFQGGCPVDGGWLYGPSANEHVGQQVRCGSHDTTCSCWCVCVID